MTTMGLEPGSVKNVMNKEKLVVDRLIHYTMTPFNLIYIQLLCGWLSILQS